MKPSENIYQLAKKVAIDETANEGVCGWETVEEIAEMKIKIHPEAYFIKAILDYLDSQENHV